jgi:hypothetical protein
VQSLLISDRKLKCLLIPGNNEHFANTVQQDRAATAVREVPFDLTAQFSIYVTFDISREVLS